MVPARRGAGLRPPPGGKDSDAWEAGRTGAHHARRQAQLRLQAGDVGKEQTGGRERPEGRGGGPAVAAEVAVLQLEPDHGALARLGAQPRGGTPKDLADHIQSELKKWAPIVQALNLKVE